MGGVYREHHPVGDSRSRALSNRGKGSGLNDEYVVASVRAGSIQRSGDNTDDDRVLPEGVW